MGDFTVFIVLQRFSRQSSLLRPIVRAIQTHVVAVSPMPGEDAEYTDNNKTLRMAKKGSFLFCIFNTHH